jgi:hypothetical protein
VRIETTAGYRMIRCSQVALELPGDGSGVSGDFL